MEYEIPKGKAKFLKGGAYLLKGANLLGISPPRECESSRIVAGGRGEIPGTLA